MILITGANGFIGSNLLRYFRGRSSERIVGSTSKSLDITDLRTVKAFARDYNPRIIIHCAATGLRHEDADSKDANNRNTHMANNLMSVFQKGDKLKVMVPPPNTVFRITTCGKICRVTRIQNMEGLN